MNEQVFDSLTALITALTEAGFPNLADVHGDLPLNGRYRLHPATWGVAEVGIWQEGEGWVHLAIATHADPERR